MIPPSAAESGVFVCPPEQHTAEGVTSIRKLEGRMAEHAREAAGMRELLQQVASRIASDGFG